MRILHKSALHFTDDVLTALQNPERRRSRRVRELLEWMAEDFDPEACDVPALNRALARVR